MKESEKNEKPIASTSGIQNKKGGPISLLDSEDSCSIQNKKGGPISLLDPDIVVVMTPRITMKVICVVYVMNGNLRNLETLMDLSLQNGINVIYVAIGPILHIVLLSECCV